MHIRFALQSGHSTLGIESAAKGHEAPAEGLRAGIELPLGGKIPESGQLQSIALGSRSGGFTPESGPTSPRAPPYWEPLTSQSRFAACAV